MGGIGETRMDSRTKYKGWSPVRNGGWWLSRTLTHFRRRINATDHGGRKAVCPDMNFTEQA